MTRLLDIGLEQLTAMVYRMGGVAEKAIDVSITRFMNGEDATKTVHEISDVLTTMTVEVENKAFELIAVTELGACSSNQLVKAEINVDLPELPLRSTNHGT